MTKPGSLLSARFPDAVQRHQRIYARLRWSATTRMALVNVLAPGNNESTGALHLVELLH